MFVKFKNLATAKQSGFATLKTANEAAKSASSLYSEAVSLVRLPLHSRIEKLQEAIFVYTGSKEPVSHIDVRKTSVCQQHSRKWGSYCPHTQIIAYIRIGTDWLFQLVLTDLGHGSNLRLETVGKNEFLDRHMYTSIEIIDGVTVETNGIRIDGVDYPIDLKVTQHNVTFHGDNLESCLIGLAEKQEKQAAAKLRAIENRKNRGEYITRKELQSRFGFCSAGIADFCSRLGIAQSVKIVDLIDKIRRIKRTSKLRSAYTSEIAQTLRYANQKLKNAKISIKQ